MRSTFMLSLAGLGGLYRVGRGHMPDGFCGHDVGGGWFGIAAWGGPHAGVPERNVCGAPFATLRNTGPRMTAGEVQQHSI